MWGASQDEEITDNSLEPDLRPNDNIEVQKIEVDINISFALFCSAFLLIETVIQCAGSGGYGVWRVGWKGVEHEGGFEGNGAATRCDMRCGATKE